MWSNKRRQRRFGLYRVMVATVLSFSFVMSVGAKSKENRFQTYRLDKIDSVAAVQELNNLTAQLGFLHSELISKRQEILNSRQEAKRKKAQLRMLATRLNAKVRSRFLSVVTEPFYKDQSQAQANGRDKKYPEVYRAWFKTLVASHEIDTEIFEMLAILGETANAHRSLTYILESGNAKNIVYLSKQARLHATAGDTGAARNILKKIRVREQRENSIALYLPDYAAFIWNRQELQVQLELAQQAYYKEKIRLERLGL